MALPVIQRLNTRLHTQRVSRAYGVEALCARLAAYLPAEQIERVRRAHDFGERHHRGQYRKSGEPYIFHPLAVAHILAEMQLDATTLIAAILHDVIEDTPAARDDIAGEFGEEVAALVDGVSKLDKAYFQSRAEAQAENLRKLILAMTQDIRVILVKLADRLHNMRTLSSVTPEQRRRIARETLEIYAPIAQRLGINTVRHELENRGLEALYPNRSRVLKKAVKQVTGNRRNLVQKIETRLSESLAAEGLDASVMGRQKNLYSIYLKMRDKHRRFLDILDLYGFRVIVGEVDECYRALGVVHHVYRPVSEEFSDFVANPKLNGYQSLHTTLLGPGGVKIEVQIRTADMHHIAERGIAAHWQYKLGDGAGDAPQAHAREWLGELMDMERETGTPLEFFENVKVDLYPDEVYVFTPKGEIRRLPKGATPVDLAYSVHTELGNRCVAARVDRHLTALNTPLANGQMVEVLTSRHGRPNPAWLGFVKTAKARSAIRDHLKSLRREEAVRLGRRLLDRSLRELGVSLRKLRQAQIDQALAELGEDSLDNLYANIGLAQRLAPMAARSFLPADETAGSGRKAQPLAVEGTEGLVLEYAKCCHPLPGDAIKGRVRVGRGIVVHRLGCRHEGAQKGREQEWVPLRWAAKVKGEFQVELRVQTQNQRGVLARLTTHIANTGCNVDNVAMSERSGSISTLTFLLSIRDRQQVARVIRYLRRLEFVERVTRH
jgi:GTP pyrophosphokinase